jgi:hypothetical protein
MFPHYHENAQKGRMEKLVSLLWSFCGVHVQRRSLFSLCIPLLDGRVVAQAVSRRLPTTAARVLCYVARDVTATASVPLVT